MLNALGAFASGLASGIEAKRDREQRAAELATYDRRLAAYGAQPAAYGRDQQNFYGASAPKSFPYDNGGGPGPAPTGAQALFALTDATEGAGSYSTLFGHSQKDGGPFAGVDVSRMTIGEAIDFSRPSGAYGQWVKGRVGHVATPMGRHQIVGRTLRSVVKEMGLPLDTPFNGATQDQIAIYLAKRRLAGETSAEGKRMALRAEWEGYKNVPDDQLDAAIAAFEGAAAPKQTSPYPVRMALGAARGM